MLWLIKFAMCTMMPRTAGLPGIADTDLDGFLRRMKKETNLLYWLGLVLGALVFTLTPLITIGVPLPAFALPRKAPRPPHRAGARPPDLPAPPGGLPHPCLRGTVLGRRREGARLLRPPPLRARSGHLPAVMSHVSFRPRGEKVELEADYVVVGSGAGGATAAVTLARGGAKVAIVEAGAWRDPPDYPASLYGAMRDMLDAWGSNFTRGRAFWPIVQASLVGGTTVINSAIGVRTPADIFQQWERDHGVGGGWMPEAVWRVQDALERELSWEEAPPPSIGRSNLLALKAANRGRLREPLHEAVHQGTASATARASRGAGAIGSGA